MQYRSFPKIPNLPISILSFGAMRLPTLRKDPSQIDEDAATSVMRACIAGGVNYVDTAYVYHNGQSEAFLGRALAGGYRDRVQLATKLPVWDVAQAGDVERLLDTQLAKLGTDHIDFYLTHALNGDRWKKLVDLGAMRAMERARADGRVRHIGFSFHGSLDDFKKITDGYDWEFTQIQLNYVDEGFQAGLEGLRYAAARRIGSIIMEPLRGGSLASAPPAVEAIWARSGRGWSAAEWALRWLWNLPDVVTVLSGMNALAQVDQNLHSAKAAAPLEASELALVDEAKRFYQSRTAVPCTSCGYCHPCPNGVAISDTFAAWNGAVMFDNKAQAAWAYDTFQVKNNAGADKCIECGECEPKCPQSIAIGEQLQRAHAYLSTP